MERESAGSSSSSHVSEEEEPMESASNKSLMCSSCEVREWKYRCPGCLAHSCSVPCVNAHKERTGCTGKRNTVVQATLQEMDDKTMHSDYRFLESVRSKLEEGFRDSMLQHLQEDAYLSKRNHRGGRGRGRRDHNKTLGPLISDSKGCFNAHIDKMLPTQGSSKFEQRIPNYRVNNPLLGGSSVLLCRSDLPPILKRLRHEVRERGTQLVFMPRDMSRRSTNTSHYVHRMKTIRWHVRVEFLHADIFFEDTVDERISVGRIVSKFMNTQPDLLRGKSLHKSTIRKIDKTNAGSSDYAAFENSSSNHQLIQCEDPGSNPKDKSGIDLKSNNFNEIMADISSTANKVLNISQEIESPTNSSEPNVMNTVACEAINMVDTATSSLNSFCRDAANNCSAPFADGSIATHSTVAECAQQILSADQAEQMLLYKAAGIGGVAVLCRNEKFDDYEKYTRFDLTESLKENLIGLRVVEHPILTVVKKDHVYEFLNKYNRREDPELEKILQSSKEVPHNEIVNDNTTMKFFDAEYADDYLEDGNNFGLKLKT